ncbi:ATP-binding cassette domain-containing protein [Aquirufa sp. HETE-83D]|uniref:ATP-binding cassette domain-containing protein n=1 Tax=Aquirufa esocilacus TaxID=3096513 RepID=A0ABW6DMM7_9BACT
MFIEAKNLSKNYGKQSAVQDLNFHLGEGEIVGFLGPNGAGKSTTLKMLLGLISPSAGTVLIDGKDPQEQNIQLKKQIGYLAENNPLYPEMYVREFLAFIGNIHQLKNLDRRIQDVIEWVGLQKEAHKKIQELSKGFQQRVGIAMAILHDPQILILDEPTSGLDPNQRDEIRNLIKSLQKDRIILFSSHILSEVEAICDRVLLINQGKLVSDSPMKEIKDLEKFFKEKTN